MCCGVSLHQCATVYVYESQCANDSSLKCCTTRTLFCIVLCTVFGYHNVTAQGPSLSLGLCPQVKKKILLVFLSTVSLKAVSILATLTVVIER
jgi:hypothetical protein